MSRVVTSLAALTAAVAGVVVLVPPALADSSSSSSSAPSGPVAVTLAGHLDTDGLGEHATVSRLTVTNTGTNPLGWKLRADQPAPVAMDYWQAGTAPCPAAAPSVASSIPALAPGRSVDVCVRLTATPEASGVATPVVTVVAHPA